MNLPQESTLGDWKEKADDLLNFRYVCRSLRWMSHIHSHITKARDNQKPTSQPGLLHGCLYYPFHEGRAIARRERLWFQESPSFPEKELDREVVSPGLTLKI